MPYDVRTAGVPVIGEASTIATPTLLPAFGAPSTIEELRDALLELWNRMSVIAAHYQQTEYRFPERHLWETLEALNIFNMTHGGTLPATRKDGTPLQSGDMHGDYSQAGIPLRPLIYDGEDWVSFLLDVQPGGAMIDQLLEALLINSNVVNAPNAALVNALRTELRGGVATGRDTLKKLSDAIDEISVPLNDLALTGNPTAPTQPPGTNNTRLATTAYADAGDAAVAAASVPLAQKGVANGVASLDSGGKVPSGQLPSHIDDIVPFANFAALPVTGQKNLIYVTEDNDKQFRWTGSAYAEIIPSPGTTDALTEGSSNLYFTNARAQAALGSALAAKQNLLSGASGFVLAFDGAGAPVARPATIKLSSWYFTSDGVANVTTAMQAFLNLGGDLLLAAGIYICGSLTIPANTRLYGARDAIIKQVTPSGDLITLQGDNTRLEGFTIDGNQTTNTFAGGYTANHRGIVCIGSSGTDRKEITLDQLEVKNFGDTGIFTRFTDGLKITGCKIFRCGYAGTQNLSPINYDISGNRVDDIFPGQTGNGNAYGITATSSTGERVAQRGIIAHNIVSNVPSWEGIDVHFGKNCSIRGNLVTGCSQGIAYENSIATLPGEDIAIDDNTIVGWAGATLVRDGQTYTKTGGIIAVGAAANEYAKTLSLRGNNVTNYGDTRPGTAGAIFARNWDGYAINNNNIRDSFRSAISLGESGTAGMINGTINDNVINGVTAHNGVCRGIEATARCSGTAMGNHVAGLASGTERYYQDPAALNPIIFHAAPREVLQADRIYYVRADGSDSNTGRVDSAAGAWRNVQTAIDRIVAALDIPSGRTVTIKVGNGSYTEAKTLRNFVGGGLIVIEGSSSPSNVDFIISAGGVNAISADRINCRWHLKGFRVGTTGSGLDAINARGPGTVVTFENLAFDVTVDDHLQAWEGAQISAIGDYFITAGAGRHVNAFDGGRITILGRTVAISNTPAFTYFANAARQGVISANGMTFTGTGATGPRYLVDSLGLIFTNAGGANYLPGNAAGTANAPGAYL